MNCNMEMLIGYCAGTLDAKASLEFEKHKAICPDCQTSFETQKAAWNALDIWEPVAVSVDFDRKLFARIQEHESSPWWTRMWRLGFSGAAVQVATACAVAVLGVMVYLPVNRAAIDHTASPVVKMEKVDLEQVETTLDDMEMLKQLGQDSAAKS